MEIAIYCLPAGRKAKQDIRRDAKRNTPLARSAAMPTGGTEEGWLVQQAQYDLAQVRRERIKVKRLEPA